MKKEYFEVVGGNKLFGEIKNQTSKNASLPIMSASLLSDGEVILHEIPSITDVNNMVKILKKIGVEINEKGSSLTLNPTTANNPTLDCELSKTMRSSLFLLGPMLQKFGEVDLTLPGGCKIGKRPIDIHIKAFKKLGVEVTRFDDHVFFKVKKAQSNRIKLKIPSVGATENIVQFACKLKGKTIIDNPAREPEVVDLCNFLNQMGAKIIGAGTKRITIYGVDKLKTTEYKPIGDRIVAGTIMTAVAIAGGDVTITNAVPYQNLKLIEILQKIGCQIDYKNDILHIVRKDKLLPLNKVTTGYYPNFPTDLQSMIVSLASVIEGETRVKETIFENRFLIVNELKQMGAQITFKDSKTAIIKGVQSLNGAKVCALDLRGGASLMLSALIAHGKTIIENIHFIDRGYDHLEEMLNALGAKTRRLCQKEH